MPQALLADLFMKILISIPCGVDDIFVGILTLEVPSVKKIEP